MNRSLVFKKWKGFITGKNLLFQNVILILLGTGINKALPFLLLPILLHLLSPNDYGIVQNFITLQSVELVLIGFSSVGYLDIKFYGISQKELDKYIITSVIVSITTAFVLVAVKLLFYQSLFNITGLSLKWQLATSFSACMQYMVLIGLQLLRVKTRIKAYISLEILLTILNLIISFSLIIFIFKSWQGRVLGIMLANIILGGIVAAYLVWKHWSNIIELPYFKEVLAFGIPLIPHQLAWWARMGLDKFVITNYYGTVEVGIYSAAAQFGLIIYLFGSSFNKVYAPRVFKELTLSPKNALVKLNKETRYLIIVIIIVVAFIGFASEIIYQFLPKSYIEGRSLIWPIVAANGLQCIYFLFVNYLFFTRKTKQLALITASVSILHFFSLLAIINLGSYKQIPYALLLTNLLLVLAVYQMSLRAKKEIVRND